MANTVDQLILEHMRSGVVTRHELLAAGASSSAIDRRLRSGVLDPIATGVYVVPQQAGQQTLLVGALAALPKAAVSRRSAGHLQSFPLSSVAAQVTVAHGHRVAIKGVTVHETRRWLDGDITIVDGLRVTSPARTLIDLASEFSMARLRHVTETQLTKSRPNSNLLLATFRAHRRRGLVGSQKMSALLVDLLDDEPYPESRLEIMVARPSMTKACRASGARSNRVGTTGERGSSTSPTPNLRSFSKPTGGDGIPSPSLDATTTDATAMRPQTGGRSFEWDGPRSTPGPLPRCKTSPVSSPAAWSTSGGDLAGETVARDASGCQNEDVR